MSVSTNTVTSLPGPDPQASFRQERENQKFDPVQMHYFLEGSKARAEAIKRLTQQMERDPVLASDSSIYDLNKEQQRELTAVKINRMARYIENDDPKDFNLRMSLFGLFDPQVATRIGINLGLFLSCVRGNGTPEQIEYWTFNKETAGLKSIYGCFGMTELAHGSNVAGLETTATYDEATEEFVINTPHIGATKWWSGGAAHSSTHCSVYARLIVKGKDYGVKTFVVPLRDSNHDLMPGVTVGDIGAKMGRDGIDNGWIQFSDVRVPRFFMLQKFCKVSKEGKVTLPPLEQLSYSALLGGRVSMVLDSYRMSAKMSTIALRYAVARRQFKGSSSSDGKETQLINYPLHQRRLFPYLAQAYVLSAAALKVEHTIEQTLDDLDAAVASNDMPAIMRSIDGMKSLFIDSGSLKSTSTWLGAEAIDQCRQACGGHGYSSYSGFGKAYNDWVVQCTWEGDNNVLAMSVGKPIVRLILEVLDKGKKVRGSTSFLNHTKENLGETPVISNVSDLQDLKKILTAIEVLIMRLGADAVKTIKANGGNQDSVSPQLVVISKLKANHYALEEYIRRVDTHDNLELKPYLLSLGRLYAASMIIDRFAGDFLTYSVLSTKVVAENNSINLPKLCEEVRPHVITYTDSFQLSDMIINSAIGKFDGNVYENYFGIVKANNPPFKTKAPYSGSLEAMLNRPAKEERERFEKIGQAKQFLSKGL